MKTANPVPEAVARIRQMIDAAGHPSRMTPEQYDDFLSELREEVEEREGLRREERKDGKLDRDS